MKRFLRLDPLMTDDDVDFWGDLLYVRGLLDAIADDCHHQKARIAPIPPIMSSMLDLALELIGTDFRADDATVALLEWQLDSGSAAA